MQSSSLCGILLLFESLPEPMIIPFVCLFVFVCFCSRENFAGSHSNSVPRLGSSLPVWQQQQPQTPVNQDSSRPQIPNRRATDRYVLAVWCSGCVLGSGPEFKPHSGIIWFFFLCLLPAPPVHPAVIVYLAFAGVHIQSLFS